MKKLLIAFLMSVAFFSCKSQPKETKDFKTVYFSDSVCVYNDAKDTVPKYIKDKFLLVTEDSTLLIINNTTKKQYRVTFLNSISRNYYNWRDGDVVVYGMNANINHSPEIVIFTIAFYADDEKHRVHSFGTILDGKIYIVKIKKPKRNDGTNNL